MKRYSLISIFPILYYYVPDAFWTLLIIIGVILAWFVLGYFAIELLKRFVNKPDVKNLSEFKALIERYESITLEEIEKKSEHTMSGRSIITSDVRERLTGFGYKKTCSLCKGCYYDCNGCIYSIDDHAMNCIKGNNKSTYDAIEEATTPSELLEAFRNRAKHMRSIPANLE